MLFKEHSTILRMFDSNDRQRNPAPYVTVTVRHQAGIPYPATSAPQPR
jgi:hypothetical protein